MQFAMAYRREYCITEKVELNKYNHSTQTIVKLINV